MESRIACRLRAGWIAGGVALCALLAGCEGGSDQADVAGADPQAAFAITDPPAGGVVHSEALTIRGVGLREPASMVVSVLTDRWYAQTGTLHHSDNNSWSYGPVYLGGSGAYNNHTIRAQVTHADGTAEAAEVSRVVRQ